MNCRSCNKEEFLGFISLNKQPPANAFLKEDDFQKEISYSLDVTCCKNCLLVQLTDESYIPRDKLFLDYAYASSISGGLRKHFTDLAVKIKSEFNPKLVVDIGSNDGVLLKPLLELGCESVGVEPARNLAKQANDKGLETICSYFDKYTVDKIISEKRKADIVVASNVFAHLDEYHEIIENVKSLLSEDGTYIIEVQYFADMINDMTFDNIYHEHVMYYTIHSLINLFNKHEMNVYRVEKIPTHGGSIRVYISEEIEIQQSVIELINEERKNGIDKLQTMEKFNDKLQNNINEIRELFERLNKENKKIFGYGAPAKSSTMINSIGLTNENIELIIEDSPLKQGLFTPGSHIPIIGPEILEKETPDYLMIFAWNYADEIIKKVEEKYSKMNYIIPMPELRIIQNK
ncbi:MAG TPA: class I SAM-dependent methyltransferase [Nitrososphaerales archaeon]|nr:class I SAM-dependent methyltransferase [Nitrososphaerota archaeon]HIC84426.1 class I SAM-dependent methyltransferase [Nitrososphaerales archaeon]